MYKPIIGLEIHAELKTESKMFCSCPNKPAEKEPNVYICPICLGHPGTLPVINKKAVEYILKIGQALNCQIAETSKFDRKNYFYPDLPKGYQISQYDQPLSENGFLEIKTKEGRRRIRIRRVHLEEDTGKLIHPEGADYSLVDFNRSGVPLMELVTEPDIRSPEEARLFAQELQLILRYLDVSEADMEKGQMRVEANISLSKKEGELGTKVEIKNLNSFRAVERALIYEIERQREILESGGKVIQETRGWDAVKQRTFSQRAKEEAHDYRYFPEPDLPPLLIPEANLKIFDLPELPQAKRERFQKEYQLPEGDIGTLVNNKEWADYFEQVCSELKQTEEARAKLPLVQLYKLVANYLLNEIPRIAERQNIVGFALNERISPENFAELIVLIGQKEISSSGAQKVLEKMFLTGADPTHIIEKEGLKQVSDEAALTQVIEEVIQENPQPVKDYQSGQEKAIQFLIGQVMKKTKGKANPEVVKKLLEKNLS